MRNNSIDGLRGQASLIVMITHFTMAFTPGILDMNYPMLFKRVAHPSFLQEVARFPLVSIFYNGNFAVLIFFVISGFVLSLIIILALSKYNFALLGLFIFK